MNLWYRFWYSRVGLALMGLLSAYQAWALCEDPLACTMGPHGVNVLARIVCHGFGRIAAVAFAVVVGACCFYSAFRPQRPT